MSKKDKLPIILSHYTRTGFMIFRNHKMGGMDFVVCGLNREIPSGESFDWKDVKWIKATLHFADTKTMSLTAEYLLQAVKQWEKEGGQDDHTG